MPLRIFAKTQLPLNFKSHANPDKDVEINEDEMIFTISIGTNAKEERLVEEIDLNGTKLVFQTGKLKFEALRVNFQCRVPIVTEVRLG